MPEFSHNLWAPWRMEYIRSLHDEEPETGCFLCRYWSETTRDAENHVVWRTDSAFAVMNRFPYTNGHLLLAPAAHHGELADFDDAVLAEITRMQRDAVRLLRRVVAAQGFNIGYNLGQCAGAGLPGHLHAHVVPRWAGDTNFMAVIGDARVISESLTATYMGLVKAAEEDGLRGSS